MNCRKTTMFVSRLLFTNSSIQRSTSKFIKFNNCFGSGVSVTKNFYKCCSTRVQNASENLEAFSQEFDTDSSFYNDIDIEAVTDNDPEKIKVINHLLTKLSIKHRSGGNLPKTISTKQWRELLELPTISQQMNLIKFIASTQAKKEERKRIKLEKRKKYEEFLEEKKKQPKQIATTSSPPVYGLSNTALFQRLRDQDIDKFYNYKLLDPYVNGPDIVFDCEYTPFMTRKEINSSAFQIGGAWRMNRENIKPFNIVYTNLTKGSKIYERLKLMYPLLDEDPGYPFTYTPKSFLDLYPKDKLIYLSPHAIDTMEVYEPDKVYIIGCMVDIVMPEPLSLAKAKKYGIKAVKFPLQKYLNWRTGAKTLNMDHCLKIMLDIKNGLDWQTALLRHIPPRKLNPAQPEQPKDENYLLDAKAIRRMYMKNKVFELLVDQKSEENP